MVRRLNLRQVEAFKAVIEFGTVSRAAEMMNVSQPAMSKLIAHLEEDTGLRLFDRIKGRLVLTRRGMRLYEEIDRIFAGLRQVENAVDAIRRDEQSRLLIGVMPALSGPFIQQATTRFLASQPNVFCSVQSRSSQWIADGLVTRKLDVGLIIVPVDNPYIIAEPLLARPVVCALPLDHRLAGKDVITPKDLDGVPFISFEPESHTHRRVSQLLEGHGVVPNVVMSVNVAPTLCEFVAAGVGVSLVHPLIVGGLKDRVAIRPFEPALQLDFQLCRIRDSRNARLVDAFLSSAREAAAEISRTIVSPVRA
ncbi:MAG TPA: LysR substrate-binding domain-containing protein [Bosea sp. (in: a-proteobacteria)]|jgi:DNA-binding transcriptional LysR family regulator|uniref:LysR substrate-binding domain-containing protein n=1 Tax=Bosea sp. (in: a-proteobacteria) TaxID=1871050 RepID=UPI002E1232AD|nr:LysR substrate-binding domain-containing protein [Bosea sp. (in: a-proteobacteria)]